MRVHKSILLLSIFPFFNRVSAQLNQETFFNGIKDFFINGLSFLFSTREIATKFLMGILFFMVLYTTVDIVFKKNWLFTSAITLVVTILSIVWIPDDFISVVRDQYGVLGITILTILPLIIILVFTVRVQSALVGQTLWVFYALYYFGLLIYKTITGPQAFLSTTNIPYFVAIIGGVVMFLFIPAIRQAIFKGELNQIKREGELVGARAKLLHKLQKEELKAYDVEARSTKDEF
ncbi:MAG: hypothetical protein ACP5N7_01835 [Candidatus Pacearchaeota archaeon]